MTPDEAYELVLAPPARRAVAEALPEAVAAAVIDFLTETLVVEPRRIGKPLRGARGDLLGTSRHRTGAVPHR